MTNEKVFVVQIDGVHYWVEKFPLRKQWALVRCGPEAAMEHVVAYFRKKEEALRFRQYLEDLNDMARSR